VGSRGLSGAYFRCGTIILTIVLWQWTVTLAVSPQKNEIDPKRRGNLSEKKEKRKNNSTEPIFQEERDQEIDHEPDRYHSSTNWQCPSSIGSFHQASPDRQISVPDEFLTCTFIPSRSEE
jgi:hypothetical protein